MSLCKWLKQGLLHVYGRKRYLHTKLYCISRHRNGADGIQALPGCEKAQQVQLLHKWFQYLCFFLRCKSHANAKFLNGFSVPPTTSPRIKLPCNSINKDSKMANWFTCCSTEAYHGLSLNSSCWAAVSIAFRKP